MTRDGFLRSLVLSPLAAIAGCGRSAEAVPVVSAPTVSVSSVWTCTTAGTGTYTIHCTDPSDPHRWYTVTDNGFAGTAF